VLVFDMAHTGEKDAECRVDGFQTLDDARDYARSRTRDSLEELRGPDVGPAELRTLWSVYGEDCSVLGDEYCGSSELDRFIAEPADAYQRDWHSLDPRRLRRFYVRAYLDDGAGHSAMVGGFLTREAKPGRDDLLRIYADDAREVFTRQGASEATPKTASVISLDELPAIPHPPSPERCPHWRVDVDFVCHDVKFGAVASGVFAWPSEPSGAALDVMTRVLMSETLAIRGDSPEYADYSDVVSRQVGPTTDALTHRPDGA
jgi:hypothetical protein